MKYPTTYNLEIKTKPGTDGRYSVMIRIHQKGQKPARLLTSVKLTERRFWNDRDAKGKPRKVPFGKWVRHHVDADALNAKLLMELSTVKATCEKLLEQSFHTPAMLVAALRGSQGGSYFVLCEAVLKDTKRKAYATYLATRTVVRAFQAWAGESLPLEGVTENLCARYHEHLKKLISPETGRPLKGVTINKYIARLHEIHTAVLVKIGMPEKRAKTLSPWLVADDLPEVKRHKARLNEQQVAAISLVEVPSTRRRVTPADAMRVWLLQYYMAGMCFSDVLSLRYRNFTLVDGVPLELTYEMLKTGKRLKLPVMPEAWAVLSHYWKAGSDPMQYILPYRNLRQSYSYILTHEQYQLAPFEVRRRLYNDTAHWNRQFNMVLEDIEKAAGLSKPLRTHNARHSFADLARRIMEAGGNLTLEDIQGMVAHSSVSQTKQYMDELKQGDTARPMQAVFGWKKE